jgi:hypothetical protein
MHAFDGDGEIVAFTPEAVFHYIEAICYLYVVTRNLSQKMVLASREDI